jgi:hypothetical protein
MPLVRPAVYRTAWRAGTTVLRPLLPPGLPRRRACLGARRTGRWPVDCRCDPPSRPATRTLARRASEQASLPETDPAFMAALRARGSMRPTVSIRPEGIAQLVVLGWLPGRHCHDPAIVADAVVQLAGAALAARFRPSDRCCWERAPPCSWLRRLSRRSRGRDASSRRCLPTAPRGRSVKQPWAPAVEPCGRGTA